MLKLTSSGLLALNASSLPVIAHYDELVDCPVELGNFWSGSFVACGVPHRFVVAGAPASFDGAKLLADSQQICETAIRFWHGTPGQARLSRKEKTVEVCIFGGAVNIG